MTKPKKVHLQIDMKKFKNEVKKQKAVEKTIMPFIKTLLKEAGLK